MPVCTIGAGCSGTNSSIRVSCLGCGRSFHLSCIGVSDNVASKFHDELSKNIHLLNNCRGVTSYDMLKAINGLTDMVETFSTDFGKCNRDIDRLRNSADLLSTATDEMRNEMADVKGYFSIPNVRTRSGNRPVFNEKLGAEMERTASFKHRFNDSIAFSHCSDDLKATMDQKLREFEIHFYELNAKLDSMMDHLQIPQQQLASQLFQA